ncbi:Imm1 family immunity protein [Actinokineospora sp. NBRC 105648]|uniref:Imm1 family immunity protein n=1 Tax=Actinokineospora sp. NBRC 105648 TaxID=3032206 RepID=UPI0024A0949A|nr:Imm1 family immunity protein [Actinokineospora sp. NBRC 105648]GLZ36461.1 hypothetical protein Acsp05_00860 [Actinokineospora sp. NBRC 105648]
MRSLTAFYGQDDDESGVILATEVDVDVLLDRIQQDSTRLGCPFLVQVYITGESGIHTPEVGVGVDGEYGAMSYSGRQWPGLWLSVGSDSAPGVTSYDFMGNETEFPRSARIPMPSLRQGLKEFLTTGGDRPVSIEWKKK